MSRFTEIKFISGLKGAVCFPEVNRETGTALQIKPKLSFSNTETNNREE